MLGACLPPASLPRLQTLELGIDAPPGGGGAVAVGTCLRSFTAITSLKICFAYAAAGNSELSNTVSDYVAAATTPAVLPNLETLAIEEFDLTTACRDSVHSVHSGVNLFLPLFAAPAVTQLSFTTNAGLISWPELLCSLQQYSNLQVLTLDADLQAAYAWPDSMRPALAPPSALQAPPALPRLHTLTISSIRGDLASDIGTIMANQAVASLTQMTLQHRHSFMHSVARSVPGVKPLIFFDSFIRRNSRVTPWEKAVAAAGQCHRMPEVAHPTQCTWPRVRAALRRGPCECRQPAAAAYIPQA